MSVEEAWKPVVYAVTTATLVVGYWAGWTWLFKRFGAWLSEASMWRLLPASGRAVSSVKNRDDHLTARGWRQTADGVQGMALLADQF